MPVPIRANSLRGGQEGMSTLRGRVTMPRGGVFEFPKCTEKLGTDSDPATPLYARHGCNVNN